MTNDKEPMTKGKPEAPFVIGSLSFVIPWSLVGHCWVIAGSLVINPRWHPCAGRLFSVTSAVVGNRVPVVVVGFGEPASGGPADGLRGFAHRHGSWASGDETKANGQRLTIGACYRDGNLLLLRKKESDRYNYSQFTHFEICHASPTNKRGKGWASATAACGARLPRDSGLPPAIPAVEGIVGWLGEESRRSSPTPASHLQRITPRSGNWKSLPHFSGGRVTANRDR
jgi:hypothetical protein